MENKKPVIDIEEIIKNNDPWNQYEMFERNSVKNAVKEGISKSLDHIIEYIGDNVEVDYNFEGNRDPESSIEVFVLKGEMERLKGILKQDLGI